MEEFTRSFEVRWADLDPNFHVRHSVYTDYCATMRFDFLEEQGFGLLECKKYGIGPVLFKETVCYIKELRAHDVVKVNLKLKEMSETGHKWIIHHELFREKDTEKVATVTIEGAWIDTKARKVTNPPPEMVDVFKKMGLPS